MIKIYIKNYFILIYYCILQLLLINIIELFINNKYIFKNINLNKYSLFKSNNFNKKETLVSFDSDDINEDLIFIKKYNGGELEPEWQWVKNISIVYTWVDGYDINFQYLKSKYNGGSVKNTSRFRSVDELRYSLRSLEKYLPWHQGMIYILTCQQIPNWLNTMNSRVKVVYHKDIFPNYAYPTFDSGTIELFLDKIPGITERFIYFNDDFFLNNYVHPCYFFTRKGFYPKIYKNDNLMNLSENLINKYVQKDKQMFKVMSYFTDKLIKKYFDNSYKYYFLHHYGYVFYRDLMEPFRQLFKEELKVFYFDKFRNWYKPHSLYLYLTFLEFVNQTNNYLEFRVNGKAKDFKNYKLPKNRTIKKYQVKIIPNSIGQEIIKYSKINDYFDKNEERIEFINTHPNILIYNFNDEYDSEKSLYQFTDFMIEKYPYSSSFEKQEYVELEKKYYNKIYLIENMRNNLSISLLDNYKGDKIFIYNEKIYIFNNIIKEYKLNIIKEYLYEKEKLSPNKIISDKEKEEIDFLLNYKGEKLSNEWKWAKYISIIYILNNFESNSEIYTKSTLIDELKFSLRSIEKYLPWFEGNIYIITLKENENDFSWLNIKNKRIKLIHSDSLLPDIITSNERKKYFIEMYLDKIPGITEKFIYLKTNYYFINYIHPRFFFSEQFYPKYFFNNSLSKEKIIKVKDNDEIFYKNYELIMKYFGNFYANHYRHLKEAPYVLYRDLFKPTRQIYKDDIYRSLLNTSNKKDLLPLYLIITYNIYGASQYFYPNYVAGYGLIRNMTTPVLNNNRTIKYYGYDIVSSIIYNYTLSNEISLNEFNFNIIKQKIKNLKKLKVKFINIKSLDVNNNNYINIKNNLLKYFFYKKSKFEY